MKKKVERDNKYEAHDFEKIKLEKSPCKNSRCENNSIENVKSKKKILLFKKLRPDVKD